ncbi:patatin-like phospholipase family protein [Sphingomonas sp. H39-1-10]|uniref:patatin-like phospholipase family protein n=1 Tax=Sphingomonas pollutisoli TaxID=3030829 RepID=UPI0023B9F7E1|nr:patatin-like phospholipase family protein [Sphingomonas pollutisoli]MDF0488666.1 patatin-like phospholipase family protein [Sphingomonas pollutisoli]
MKSALLAASLLTMSGCVTIPREPFTQADHAIAYPVGFPHVRYEINDPAVRAMFRPDAAGTPPTMLALSGGGANGAFGAGVLYGWTQAGTRPEFSVVTGVSTGALIAPFAFLGPKWDAELRKGFTDGEASHLLPFPFVHPLFRDSIYTGKRLRALVDSFITPALMAAVAREQARGRRLLVATTDLDSQDLVVWDMGAIAARGGPAARDLFATVLTASAAIPGVFPPVMIDAQMGSHRAHELHVDGSTIGAFFALPDTALILPPGQTSGGSIYVLVNGKADDEFAVTKRSLLSLLSRSFDTASKATQRTSLATVAAFGQQNHVATFVAAVPPDETSSSLDFRQPAMQALFELGRARMMAGTAWADLPASLKSPAKAP